MQSLLLLSRCGTSPTAGQPLTLQVNKSLSPPDSLKEPADFEILKHNEVSVKELPRRNNVNNLRATPGSMASKTQQPSQTVQVKRREFSPPGGTRSSSWGGSLWGFTWMSVWPRTCAGGGRVLIILANSQQTTEVCNTGLHYVRWRIWVND